MCNKTRKRETHSSFMHSYSSSSLQNPAFTCLCGKMQRDKTKFLLVGGKWVVENQSAISFTAELLNHGFNSLGNDSVSPCAQLLLTHLPHQKGPSDPWNFILMPLVFYQVSWDKQSLTCGAQTCAKREQDTAANAAECENKHTMC